MFRHNNRSKRNNKSKTFLCPCAATKLCNSKNIYTASPILWQAGAAKIKKIKRKYFFTLVEVMIALFIAAILLGVVFRFFSQIMICEKRMQNAKEYVLEKNNLEIKLTSIFSQLIYKNFSKDPFFYTKDNSLYFHFDNGIDPNPQFSSEVAAQIFIDKNSDLILQIRSLDKKYKICREEILMKNAAELSFEFIKKVYPKTPGQNIFFETVTSWDKKQESIPATIKINLKNKEDEILSFAFFLPTMQSSITYFDKQQ